MMNAYAQHRPSCLLHFLKCDHSNGLAHTKSYGYDIRSFFIVHIDPFVCNLNLNQDGYLGPTKCNHSEHRCQYAMPRSEDATPGPVPKSTVAMQTISRQPETPKKQRRRSRVVERQDGLRVCKNAYQKASCTWCRLVRLVFLSHH